MNDNAREERDPRESKPSQDPDPEPRESTPEGLDDDEDAAERGPHGHISES
jgi:hypothetical protein